MLEPQERRLLLDALRPPVGYQLDQAVGTTFTLDLLALLTAPLAFTLFDLDETDGRPHAEPLALLKATRDHADAITIFCQAGRIAVPPENQLLYSHLEESVVETTAPAGGVFHPKLWVLRYRSSSGPVAYRLLCLSRNLTFDRSWDVCLRLDGELRRRRNAYAANHPLGDFIAALPGLALRAITRPRRAAIETMAEEVRRVEFELPNGFEDYRFHPLGLPGYRRSPFSGDMRRTLVVSPFIDGAGLEEIIRGCEGDDHVLVGRTEQLARLEGSEVLEHFPSIKVLDDSAEAELEAAARADEEEASLDRTLDGVLRGLHAKVYVSDAGWDARAWVGSANATQAALHRNVEFMVELVGRSRASGVHAVLDPGTRGVPGFEDLLMDWEPGDEVETDEVGEALEREAERLQSYLAEQRLVANVDGPDADRQYSLTLARPGRNRLSLPALASLRAWLITQAPHFGRPVTGRTAEHLVRLDGIEIEQLTSFVAFELELRRDRRKHVSRFVLNVPLRGAPRGRRDAVLRVLLHDKERLLRYLLFILAEAEGVQSLSPGEVAAVMSQGQDGDGRALVRLQLPLFEGLVRTLARDPKRLAQIARLLDDLGEGEDVDQLLPEGFREVWDPIWAARGRR